MSAQPLPTYVSPIEAAIYAHVSSRTVRRWIAEGRLPAKRFGPRLIRVKLSDVEALGSSVPTLGA